MKRKSIVFIFLFISLGITSLVFAQGTHKKKKKKHTTQASQTDSSAVTTTRVNDSIAKASANAMSGALPTPPDGVLDTGHTDFLVADTSTPPIYVPALDSTRPIDGLYKIPLLRGAKPFAFPKENRNNIKFYKRIWREINLKDSVNSLFCMPGETLISTILDAIKNNKLIAYKDEKFTSRLTYTQAYKELSITDSESVTVPDVNGNDSTFRIAHPFNVDSVALYELKEDVYFDKTRGRLITTIVGFSPVVAARNSQGIFMSNKHAFWLYYPQCRNVFASKEIYDTQRDLYNISYDDIFIQRAFKSTIVKESSPLDLYIKDIPDGKGGLKFDTPEKQKKEADRIESDLNKYKKDVWKY
jgi:gliding motility associated protien GldN